MVFRKKLFFSFFIIFLSFALYSVDFGTYITKFLKEKAKSYFFGEEKIIEYITFDLNLYETDGNLKFKISTENIPYIISKEDLDRLNNLKKFCESKNDELKKLKEKLASAQWMQYFNPSTKKNFEKMLNNFQTKTIKELDLHLKTINRFAESKIVGSSIRFKKEQPNNNIVISWDRYTNNLLILKILTFNDLYTTIEGFKSLLPTYKEKLSTIHEKWNAIKAIQNIKLQEKNPNTKLDTILENFVNATKKNLDQKGTYIKQGKQYLVNTLTTLIPLAVFGSTGVTAISAIRAVTQSNLPDFIKNYMKDIFDKIKVNIFLNNDPFIQFVLKGDTIEKVLLNIFVFTIDNKTQEILSVDIKNKIINFNNKLKEYLQNCLIEYKEGAGQTLDIFNLDKEELVESLQTQFNTIKSTLSNIPEITLEQIDESFIVKITDIHEITIQIKKLLNDVDEKTKTIFNKKINQEKNLLNLKKIKEEVKKIIEDTNNKNKLINEILDLIKQLDKAQQGEYQQKINILEMDDFNTDTERINLLLDLQKLKLELENQILTLKPKQNKGEFSFFEKIKTTGTRFKKAGTRYAFGWLSNEEKIELKNFINKKYDGFEKNYNKLQTKNNDIALEIAQTKQQFLAEADTITLAHPRDDLMAKVENEITKLEDRIRALKITGNKDAEPQ